MKRSLALLAALLGVACSRRGEPPRPSAGAVLGRPTPLATFLDEPAAGAPTPELTFSTLGGGVAWAAEQEGKFRVFHDGHEGRPYDAVGRIALSPDGRRCAFGALREGKWRIVVDGAEGRTFDAVQDPVFSPDGRHLAYRAQAGERWYLVVDGRPDAGTRGRPGRPAFSGDSARLVFSEEGEGSAPGRLVVTDLRFERATAVDGNVADVALDSAGTRVAAVSQGDQGWRVVTLRLDAPGDRRAGAEYDAVYGLAFGLDGRTVTYRGVRGTSGFVVRDGVEEPFAGDRVVAQAAGPGGTEVGVLVVRGTAVHYHAHFAGGGRDEGPFDEAEALVFSAGGQHAYAARRGDRWRAVVNGKEGPAFDRVVTPRFSPDGERLVYRARRAGRRFVVVADLDGRTLREHPAHDEVFPVVFTADGRAVAYGVRDGRRLAWTVEPL